MPQRIWIFGGGDLGAWALEELVRDDRLVGADRGAWFLVSNGYRPELSIGDFDSVTAEEAALIRENSASYADCDAVDKDKTDLELAFDWAIAERPAEIVVVGATGTRFDHTLANVQLLRKASEAGIPCRIVDARNEIRLARGGERTLVRKGPYHYVSLLPLAGEVRGITLTGFRYPLNDATLPVGSTLGVSNELLGESGVVESASGDLLVISSRLDRPSADARP